MDAQIENLVRLQQLDDEIRQLTASLAALPRHLAEVEREVERRGKRVAELEAKLKEEDRGRRGREEAVREQQGKIVRFRGQTSSVKNNEQFHALQHEIGFAEAEIRRLEDAELEAMERVERIEAQLGEARKDLAAEQARLESERAAGRRAAEFQEASLRRWRGEREGVRPRIEAGQLAHYDRVAAARGTGLARASQQRCTGCQMGLRPQAWNQVREGGAREGGLMACESCGRLLYFDQKREPQMETGAGGNSAAGARPA